MASSAAAAQMPLLAPARRASALIRRQRRAGWWLISPPAVVLLMLSVVPVLAAIWLSFTRYDMLTAPQWVGIKNYVSLFNDPTFWESVGNTLEFAVGQVGIGIVVVVLVALLFNEQLHGGNVMRTIVYLPQAASYVVVALFWNLLLDPASGPVDRLVTALHLPPLYFLTDTHLAMASIIALSLWRNLGYFMIIVLAALQSVPTELLEAAQVDGASAARRFFAVTLPSISSAVSFVAITWFLGALQMFTQSYVLTGGGPVNATRTIVYEMYDAAFTNLDMGRACAISVLLFAAVAAISVAIRQLGRVTRRYA